MCKMHSIALYYHMLNSKFKIRLSRGTPGHPGTGCPGGPRDKCPGGVPGCPGDPPGQMCRGPPGRPQDTFVPATPPTGTPRDMSPVPIIIDYRNHAGADFPDASLHFGPSGLGPASPDSSGS